MRRLFALKQTKNKESSLHWHGLLLPGLMDGVRVLTGFRALHLIRNLSIALKFVRVEPTGIMPIPRVRNRTAFMAPL